MDKEEFIKKIKEINAIVPNEYFFLEYNKCVCDILEENQELKEQLEVGKEQYNDLVEEKEKIQEQLSSNTLQFENQQKEFIEWLEEKIPRSSCIGEDGFGRIQYESYESKNIYYEINKILLKYKEIIGVKDE